MTNERSRIAAFAILGGFLDEFCEFSNANSDKTVKESPSWHSKLEDGLVLAGHKNGWFTRKNVLFSLQNWGRQLTDSNLNNWLSTYDLTQNSKKTVALIMAGNIPLVGFHDFLCVLLCGNKALIKLSDSDKILLPVLAEILFEIEPALKTEIEFADGKLEHFDAVIATGSNNTSRYFEYYFGNKPNIIRKNRSSVAVLTGNESSTQLQPLGHDIFNYYGLGCRSVSKLFVPKDYDFDVFFKSIYSFQSIIDQQKYANNYDYNKAVYLMSEFKILDNGFLILKEDSKYNSPIASLNYEFYSSKNALENRLLQDEDQLQCIVSSGFAATEIEFGETQTPDLNDYADGIDTVDFLLRKNVT